MSGQNPANDNPNRLRHSVCVVCEDLHVPETEGEKVCRRCIERAKARRVAEQFMPDLTSIRWNDP